MFTLEIWAADTLAKALGAGWHCYADCATPGRRDSAPMCIVQLQPGGVAANSGGAVQLQPMLSVQLVARRASGTAAALGEGIAAAVAALHGAAPGEHDGRLWERLALQSMAHPLVEDEGFICAELIFATSARYFGCADSQ